MIKRFQIVIILMFSVLCRVTEAQTVVARLYYNDNWQLVSKDSAKFFRVCLVDTISRTFVNEVKDYSKEGKLTMTGNYLAGRKNGEFTFYYPNGQIESVGNFLGKSRVNIWKYYYEDGTKKSEIDFGADSTINIIFFDLPDGTRSLTRHRFF